MKHSGHREKTEGTEAHSPCPHLCFSQIFSVLNLEAVELIVFADQNRRGQHRRPESTLITHRGLRDIHGPHDFV